VMRDRQVIGIDVPEALGAVKARTDRLGGLMRSVGGVARMSACPCGQH